MRNGAKNQALITGRIAYGSDGTDVYPIYVDSNGDLRIGAGAARLGIALEDPHEVRVVKNFDAAVAYAANDVMSDDVCTTTSPTEYWTFTGMANANGGYGVIDFATLMLETENQEPRISLLLFNAIPTGVLTDNLANTNPVKADIAKWVGNIDFPATNKEAANVASTSQVGPSTVGGCPLYYKCAAGSTTLYGVTVTRSVVTLTANDDCSIALQVKHL